jgi:hypothetical protein
VPSKKDGKGDAVDGGDADLDRTGASGAVKATGATRGGAAADSGASSVCGGKTGSRGGGNRAEIIKIEV